jgi:[acyl-carrier-protein] S-malonyltransferase
VTAAHVERPTDHVPETIGWVSGEAVPLALLEVRIAELRAGPMAAALPRPGTSEARQLRRWAAHVLFTELICGAVAQELGLRPDGVLPLDPVAAIQLGSITAAAWQQSPAVGAVCRAKFPSAAGPGRPPAEAAVSSAPLYRVSHAFTSSDPSDGAADELRSMGWTTLDDLPIELAGALAGARPGLLVGPVRSELGWHLARVEEIVTTSSYGAARAGGASEGETPDGGDSLRAFTLWLDRSRAERLSVAVGFEHPGDPRQPDNTHRH